MANRPHGPDGTLHCSRCRQFLPADAFPREGPKKAGRPNAWCKRCHSQYNRNYFKAHPGLYARRKRERARRLAAFIRNLKEGRPCADCGASYPYFVMDFDHVGAKRFAISKAPTHALSVKRLLEEIDRCELVCANCHRVRTWKRLQVRFKRESGG